MVEAGARRAPEFRRWLVSGAGLAALACAVVLLASTARAAAPAGFGSGQLPVPGSFQLQASNGYSLAVLAEPPRNGRPGGIILYLSGAHGGVRYSAPATVTETSIEADLGTLGKISLVFQRSGQAAMFRCGKQDIRYDSGSYIGTIEFHGEEGYTDVAATSVPGDIKPLLSGFCSQGVFGSEGGEFEHSRPGGELQVRNPALGAELWAVKNRPSAAAVIEAVDREFVSDISIVRFSSVRTSAGVFTYDRRLRTATLRPPAPFSGAASYDRGKKAGKRWSGDLTVDMPGHADLPLTGGALRATLTPYG